MIRRLKVKHVGGFFISLLVLYLAFLKPILLKDKFEIVVNDVNCKDVFDFMADFG